MTISHQEIKNVAFLARLGLDEKDIPTYDKNLNNILALMAQMQTVDTSHISPMSHTSGESQPLRADIATEPEQRDAVLANAPATEFGLFLVPQVIE